MKTYRQPLPLVYDWASFSLANGQTDYDVSANQSALFANVPVGKHVAIIFNQAIGIKFNNTGLPRLNVTIDKSPFQTPEPFLELTNIYLTNSSGFAVTVEILLW